MPLHLLLLVVPDDPWRWWDTLVWCVIVTVGRDSLPLLAASTLLAPAAPSPVLTDATAAALFAAVAY